MSPCLPNFEHASVLVIGDCMLDRYWSGDTARISPEAPVPVVRVEGYEQRLGGAGNVALNVAQLGARASVLGLVGSDAEAELVASLLEHAGIENRLQRVAECPTVTKLRVLSRHQQLLRLDFEDAFPRDAAQALTPGLDAALPACDAVVISDYGKGAVADPQALIAPARAAGKPVLVDPKGRDFARYRGATVITPNRSELEAVIGGWTDHDELIAKVRALMAEIAVDALLVTQSEQGMTLVRADAPPIHMPARAREVFDVTGAGDTVIGVLAAALAAGAALAEAADLANLAAGLVVGKVGTATVSPPELRRALNDTHANGYGAVDEDELIQAVADARAHGERIVMTNGCFDILHAGHVAYLQALRELGDRLVVAVNDDASVRELKGPGRPVSPLAERMAVVGALAPVDWVVAFSEPTPQRLIERVAPDVLGKGGDYRPEDIAGHDAVVGRGGRVVCVDYRDGCSSSAILERVRRGEGAKP